MDSESRPKRSSGKSVQVTAGSKVETDSRPAGTGGQKSGIYINERGQVCYGDQCVTLTIDDERREIVVNVKRNAVCNIDPLVEAMRDTLGKGARTVYEVESELKEK
jgi:hypothetical protein